MKRILIISHWFYPSNNPRSFRARALCDEMRRMGYEVDILVGSDSRILDDSEIEKYYLQKDNESMMSRSNSGMEFSFVKKVFRYFFGEKFIFTHLNKCRKIVNIDAYSTIISIGNPFYVHLIVESQRTSKQIWICDCGDPFYINKKKHSFIVKSIQNKVFSNADFISIPIKEAVDYYSNFIQSDKIKVIPQGFSMKNIIISKYESNPIPTFSYAGQFYEDIRNPTKLLQYLSGLDRDFIFKLYIPQNNKIYHQIILPFKKIMGNRLEILPQIPREECIYELSKCDFLLNIMNVNSIQSPSKLIDYCITKRPILSINPDDISESTILNFLDGDYREETQVDMNYYNIHKVTKQFINLIEDKIC